MSTLLVRDLCKLSRFHPPPPPETKTQGSKELNSMWLQPTPGVGEFAASLKLSLFVVTFIPTGTRQTSFNSFLSLSLSLSLSCSRSPHLTPTPLESFINTSEPPPPSQPILALNISPVRPTLLCSSPPPSPRRNYTNTKPDPSLCVIFHTLLIPSPMINTVQEESCERRLSTCCSQSQQAPIDFSEPQYVGIKHVLACLEPPPKKKIRHGYQSTGWVWGIHGIHFYSG